MAGIIEQAYIVMGQRHKAVNLFRRLDPGAHMVMQRHAHALFCSQLRQFVIAFCRQTPLFIAEHRFLLKHRQRSALNTFALL